MYVVCDRQSGMLNALANVWPGTTVYPCTQHLRMNAEEIIRIGKLRGEQPVAKLVHEKTFVRRADYEALTAEVDRLHRDQQTWEALSKEHKDAANRLDAWLTTNGPMIGKSINEPHAPLTIGGLENPLHVIKTALKYRRKVLRKLERLNHLLVLLQLRQNSKKGRYSDIREVSATPDAAAYDARFQRYTLSADAVTKFHVTRLRTNAVLRWEYSPGSTVFLVWAHGRENTVYDYSERSWSRDYREIFELHPNNTFLIKVAYWLNR